MKLQKRFIKLLCLVLALTVLLPAIPARASTDALGVGYHASTTFTDENAVGKAFDNDPATRWSACADQNQWICAIFENEVVINSVEILEFWDRMTSFEIQYLDENGAWQTCASKITNTQNTQTDTTHQLSFAPVKTTGMRLYIHDAPGWPSIYEFKMFYGGIQIVDGKSAVGYHASTTFAEENAVGKSFDNDPATRWSACAEQNQWICAIFENEVVIDSVEINEFWDRTNAFDIQYLDENGIWQTCASKVIDTPDTGIDTTHQLSFAPVKTTGMRLYIHDAPGWPSIYEFEMFYGGIQIVEGKLPLGYHASTTFGDEHVGKAFDNDPNTRWSGSAEQNQWICAIFENEVVINSVEILEFWDRMTSFEIQYLDENGVWQTCASKITNTQHTQTDTTHQLSFAPVRTNGMRLYIHDAPNWASIYEFKMFYGGIQIVDGKSAVGYHASTTFVEENAVGKAFDNDPATRWSACAEQNQWICAIFENEVVINSVEILEFWDRMNAFDIQYLDENGIWQTCASKVIDTPDTGIDTTHQLYFDAVKTTGMRLYIHDAPGWPSIYEFKMYSDRPAPVEYIAQVGEQSYASVTEAISNANGQVVKILADTDEEITVSDDVIIDLAGHTLQSVTVAEGATLYGIDSGTDDYDCSDGYGKIVNITGNYAKHFKTEEDGALGKIMRYMAIVETDGVSFHRFYMGITKLSLTPAVTGFGYKAEFYGDEMVQQQIASIGYKLWITENAVVTRTNTFKNTLTLRLKNFDVVNYGETPVNASVNITLTDGTVIESGVTSMSMRDMLESINSVHTQYSEAQLTAVKEMIEKHAIIKSWDTENLFA